VPIISLTDFLGRGGRKIGTSRLKLPDSVVTHDSIDSMEFDNYTDDSPRFRRIAIEDAPVVTPDVPDPDPIDMTTASPDEFVAYQQAMKAAREARENAPTYSVWDKLTRDVFYSYHTHDMPELVEPVDPGVELHKRVMPKLMTTDDHAQARNITRDNPTTAAIATMAAVNALKQVLGDELEQQMREAEEYQQHAQQAQDASDQLDFMRQQAKDLHQQGLPVPDVLKQQIGAAVQERRAAQQAALGAAASQTPMSAAAMQAIQAAAAAAGEAASGAAGIPSFGAGFGAGEPTYESPEQALTIAEMWANNPQLRAMAERFGRLDRDIRFQRSKRVVGGNDEIVDVEFGDNLQRVLPAELALLADEDTEDDFLVRYASQELLCFATVGEEHAGRGPIVVVVDGSYSMNGERNIWARAVAMCLLHIARLEKRDFACVEFADARQVEAWVMPAKKALGAQEIVDMASHFFGGGTSPIQGVAGAVKIMEDAADFRKADLVMIGDGEASFGPEDKRLRDQLIEMGVRLFGIAIGNGPFKYLADYCSAVVPVHDFELQDPSQATAELATHIT
jgi:uncharacterized protein with von Willebrand factor type A (vWA) domain